MDLCQLGERHSSIMIVMEFLELRLETYVQRIAVPRYGRETGVEDFCSGI